MSLTVPFASLFVCCNFNLTTLYDVFVFFISLTGMKLQLKFGIQIHCLASSSAGGQVIRSGGADAPSGPSSLQYDDDSLMLGASPASIPKPVGPHVCRAVRSDNMSRLNLQGAVHIRDADFITEEIDILDPTLQSDRSLNVSVSGCKTYAFAW